MTIEAEAKSDFLKKNGAFSLWLTIFAENMTQTSTLLTIRNELC